jgi:hypothetical protein
LVGFLSVVVVAFLGQHAFTGRKPSFASALNVYQSMLTDPLTDPDRAKVVKTLVFRLPSEK